MTKTQIIAGLQNLKPEQFDALKTMLEGLTTAELAALKIQKIPAATPNPVKNFMRFHIDRILLSRPGAAGAVAEAAFRKSVVGLQRTFRNDPEIIGTVNALARTFA